MERARRALTMMMMMKMTTKTKTKTTLATEFFVVIALVVVGYCGGCGG
jgi:hypothetical protein